MLSMVISYHQLNYILRLFLLLLLEEPKVVVEILMLVKTIIVITMIVKVFIQYIRLMLDVIE